MFATGDRIIWTSNVPHAASQYRDQPGKITGIQCDADGNRLDIYYLTLDSGIWVTSTESCLSREG